jgi:hypothetical protein
MRSKGTLTWNSTLFETSRIYRRENRERRKDKKEQAEVRK